MGAVSLSQPDPSIPDPWRIIAHASSYTGSGGAIAGVRDAWYNTTLIVSSLAGVASAARAQLEAR